MCSTRGKIFIVIALSTSFLAIAPIFSFSVSAQIKINEVSSATSDDWVEIYNISESLVDLSYYEIRDSTQSNKHDLTGTIDPGGLAVFNWPSKLNNDGDTVKIIEKSTGSIIDEIEYGGSGFAAPHESVTIGRRPDGSDVLMLLIADTKAASNNEQQEYVAPTPTALATPTPTKTPTPIKTPTPTKTPTKAPAASFVAQAQDSLPKTTVNNTTQSSPSDENSSASIASFPTAVLGAGTRQDDEKVIRDPDVKIMSSKLNLTWTVAIGGAFLLACAILLFLRKRSR